MMSTGATNINFFGYKIPAYVIVTASTWASRLIMTITSILTIRILLSSLGIDEYASYAVLSGLAGWFLLADLGIGVSLQNYISEFRATGQDYGPYIRTAAKAAALLMFAFVTAICLLGKWPAEWLLNRFSFLSSNEKYLAFLATAVPGVTAAVGALIYRIWYAEHRGYLANLATAIAAIFSLALVYAVSISSMQHKLAWSLLAAGSPLALVPGGSLLVSVFAHSETKLPAEKIGKRIVKRGTSFWLFNVAAIAVLQIDYIVLSQFAPPSQIVIYNLGAKIFAIAGFMFSAVHQAFWPVCAEAAIRRDWKVIDSFARKYLLWGVLFLVGFTSVFILVRARLLTLFFANHKELAPVMPVAFILGMGGMYLVRLWTDLFAVILQSMNDLKVLLFWATVQAFVGLGLQLLLVPRYGIYGTVGALSCSWILTVGWALPRTVWRRQALSGQVVGF